jgi:MFS family permease
VTAHRPGGLRTTFTVLLVAVSAFALMGSLVNPVLGSVQRKFGVSEATTAWVLTAYLLSASVSTPTLGRLGDIVGKRRVLAVTFAVVSLGSVLAAVTNSIGVLIAARAVQGVGGAVYPLAFGIVRDQFPRERASEGIGVLAAMVAVGGGASIILAGPIVDGLGYRWLFLLPALLAAGAAAAAFAFIPESPRAPGAVSVSGSVLLSVWLVALLLAVSQGTAWGWTSPRVLCLFGGAVICAGLWCLGELRGAAPVVDVRLMRQPAIWTNNLVSLLFGVGIYSVLAFLPQYLQAPRRSGYGLGASILGSGIYLLPLTAAMFVAGVVSNRLSRALGPKATVVLGSGASAAGFLVLAVAHSLPWQIFAACTVLGAGLGLSFAALSSLIVMAVPSGQTGAAAGMNANIRTVGGSIGAAATASIISASGPVPGLPSAAGYANAFAFLFVVSVLALGAAGLIPAGQTVSQSGAVMDADMRS